MKGRFLVFFILAASVALPACADEALFSPMEYTERGDEVRSLIIDVRDRSIDVLPSDDGQIHIRYSASSREGYDIRLEDGYLSMHGISDKSWKDYIGRKPSAENRKIVLEVPEIALDTVSIKTTNESMTIHYLPSAGDIRLSSNGGDILFEDLEPGETIALDVKNGDIRGSIIGGWDDYSIRCSIKKGDCNLPASKDGGEKTLYANANNGDIHIDFVIR